MCARVCVRTLTCVRDCLCVGTHITAHTHSMCVCFINKLTAQIKMILISIEKIMKTLLEMRLFTISLHCVLIVEQVVITANVRTVRQVNKCDMHTTFQTMHLMS